MKHEAHDASAASSGATDGGGPSADAPDDAVRATAPAWQPVPTRRTVMPAEPATQGASTASTARDVARDLARGFQKEYAGPRRGERLVWAATGALATILFAAIVRRVTRR